MDLNPKAGSREISPHTFHIPVMGTGYSIDTPLKVARYGISSVVSLVDDVLLEQMRRYHLERQGEAYIAINKNSDDPRAERVTAYLDLLDRLVGRDVERLRSAPFEPGSDISRYFELLPDGADKQLYAEMRATDAEGTRESLQQELRRRVVAGSIDVNIMTKIDRAAYKKGEPRPAEYNDAMAALRGFANSTVDASVVLSAGLNPKLYSYLSAFDGFFPDADGHLKKRIVLKVSDYRSALVQAKYLARSGLWVSEFRVEGSIDCGGHAFVTEGQLLGPILEQFKEGRSAIIEAVRRPYEKALIARGQKPPVHLPAQHVTVQGGIGTASEDRFLRHHFGIDSTGWATPFMLVPEVTNVDGAHLEKLAAAGPSDVYLSNSSPFGVPFWMLRDSASEQLRQSRIHEGRPGSPCVKGYLNNNTEFPGRPICGASRTYQKKKLAQLDAAGLSGEQLQVAKKSVTDKACICHDLAGGATRKLNIDPAATPTVTVGPNIVNFARTPTLDEMIGHIYGRGSLLSNDHRPHMFIRELELYFDELKKQVSAAHLSGASGVPSCFAKFKHNLGAGIDYYQSLAAHLPSAEQASFREKLAATHQQIEQFFTDNPVSSDQ